MIVVTLIIVIFRYKFRPEFGLPELKLITL